MKYDVKAIMTRAWEIRKQNAENHFPLCLKMAWEEAKKPSYLKGEALYQRLVEMGASRWTKGGHERIYFNDLAEKLIGLEFEFYHSGNVSAAWLNGEPISNSEGRRIAGALSGLYLNAATGKLAYYSSRIADEYIPVLRAKLDTIPA